MAFVRATVALATVAATITAPILLFFLGILAFIPRLHIWCCLFCSACLFSSSLSPKVASLGCFSCWPPSLVVPAYVFGVSFCGGGAVSSSSPPAGCGVGSC